MKYKILSIAFLFVFLNSQGQTTDTTWKVFDNFPGNWKGKNIIGNDQTIYSRKYYHIFDGAFIKIEESHAATTS